MSQRFNLNSDAKWRLSLFIAGPENPKSMAAYSNIKRICEEHVPGNYELAVIDVVETPAAVEEQQLLAVPTLVRHDPRPTRRIIGDLGDTERMLVSLGISLQSVS